jgi:hypothetical protein
MQQCVEEARIVGVVTSHDPLTKPTEKELIVATTDHTAPACPSVRNELESDLVSYIDRTLCLQGESKCTRDSLAAKLAGVLHGIATIESLLDRWLTEQRAYAREESPPQPRPLKVQHVNGLNAALSILRQQGEQIRLAMTE